MSASSRSRRAGYTGEGLNGYAYLSHDAVQDVYTVISVGYIKKQRSVDANLIVRLVADKIVVERDMNDKILAMRFCKPQFPVRRLSLLMRANLCQMQQSEPIVPAHHKVARLSFSAVGQTIIPTETRNAGVRRSSLGVGGHYDYRT